MSSCGKKKNTETVAQYRKRCGGRPLGMIQKVSEGDDKVELIKLYNKAFKMIPGSANQKKITKQISVLRKKLKMNNEQHTCHDCGQSIDINEAGFKFVIRNKKKIKKLICPPGTKSKGRKKCVRMASKERIKRAKGLKVTRRKAKGKLAKTLRKRAKSMKKRKGMGLSESLKLEELVGKPITEAQFDEAAGEKDACYRKVKARYDVWPSAYASGALVKCRKVGAKNWGNKSKKESIEESYDIWNEDGSFGYTMTGLIEAEYQGRKVKLGKPMQGDTKKFKVYVKNDKGNVVKVNFGQGGDAKGGTMRIRKSNPKARKSFRARHNCDNPGPRHKARYWSCKKW